MNNRTNIRKLVPLMTGIQVIVIALAIAQPSYGGGHGGGGKHGGGGHGGGGHGGGGHEGGGHEGGGHEGYHRGNYHHDGYPAYYAPAYNNCDYREYSPYPRYRDTSMAAFAGGLVGGLLGAYHGHRYE